MNEDLSGEAAAMRAEIGRLNAEVASFKSELALLQQVREHLPKCAGMDGSTTSSWLLVISGRSVWLIMCLLAQSCCCKARAGALRTRTAYCSYIQPQQHASL